MKLKYIQIIVAATIVAFALFVFAGEPFDNKINIGNGKLSYEVADEQVELELGLSGRTAIDRDHGLLFDFNKAAKHGIWMKDMKFAIDIIWLDENRQVVDIAPNVTPETYPIVFTPASAARYVLEINSGVAEEIGVMIGQKAKF